MLPTMKTLVFTFFVYASFAVAFTHAASLGGRSWREDLVGVDPVDGTIERDQDQTAFSRLVRAVSPQSLRQLLHEYIPNPFNDGRQAAEAAYAGNSILATSVVHLALRQATSGNDTTTSDTSTSSEVPTTTSATPSTSSSNQETTSTPQGTTSTAQAPTETTSTTQDTLTSASSTPTTTPAPTPTPSTDTITRTPSPSTTATPTSKTSTFTSTLPNGAVTTVTQVTVVTPGVDDNNGTPTDAVGNLQTGSAAPILRRPGIEILAGFLVGGIVLA
ncbi:hypothetical protein NUW58_g6851 [Xylaria curta]|uniref:Uncharacterized protein n=1 Tax=Xylaria curta TaxID=42375 RepID=A0ACC1NQM1_9PEZI|nr:hypothetical protein NUW58_g6851 [Xylaria curta]